jgi:hypothetical protein
VDGRVVYLGQESLLEMSLDKMGANPWVHLYADPAREQILDYTQNLNPTTLWIPLWQGFVSNRVEVVIPPAGEPVLFFRARSVTP